MAVRRSGQQVNGYTNRPLVKDGGRGEIDIMWQVVYDIGAPEYAPGRRSVISGAPGLDFELSYPTQADDPEQPIRIDRRPGRQRDRSDGAYFETAGHKIRARADRITTRFTLKFGIEDPARGNTTVDGLPLDVRGSFLLAVTPVEVSVP